MAYSAEAMPHFGPPMGSIPSNVNSPLSSISSSNISLGQAMQEIQEIEPVEWAKFCMWLRGYLSAVEGKELTTEDTAKIMEKLATVDPDSHGWRYNRGITMPPAPYQSPPFPGFTPNNGPQWTVTTTDGTNEVAPVLKIMCGKTP